MKNLIILLFLSLALSAGAQNVSGFYTGTLFNDSTKMVQKYELALSDYRGKIDGYSYVTFVKNDTFYYGIRKVKARIEGDSLIVTDDKMISNNFPEPPAKGVGRVITIPLKGQDSLVIVSGRWKTNQTKKYYSVPGAIDLNRSTDSSKSPLISHLQELNLIETPNYYQNMNTQPLAVAATEKKTDKSKKNSDTGSGSTDPAAVTKSKQTEDKKKVKDPDPQVSTVMPSDNNSSTATTSSDKKKKTKDNTVPTAKTPTDTLANVAKNNNPGGNETVSGKKRDTKLPKDDGTKDNTVKDVAAIKNQEPANVENPKPDDKKNTTPVPVAVKPSSLPYEQRTSKLLQTIEVESDSLVLAFYDNGVVDGDSVSVYVDGKAVAQNLRLTTSAAKRVITVDHSIETTLLLVAENLGRLPPNTGLITIRDGENLYQVHFSADMMTNATIVIRRKKK